MPVEGSLGLAELLVGFLFPLVGGALFRLERIDLHLQCLQGNLVAIDRLLPFGHDALGGDDLSLGGAPRLFTGQGAVTICLRLAPHQAAAFDDEAVQGDGQGTGR